MDLTLEHLVMSAAYPSLRQLATVLGQVGILVDFLKLHAEIADFRCFSILRNGRY